MAAVPWGNNRLPAPSATPSTRTAVASVTSATLGGLLTDCHQVYTISVTPMMGSVPLPRVSWPNPVRPSGVVSPTEPNRVVILLDGIRESKPQENFDPYHPTGDGMPSYCPEAWSPSARTWGESDFALTPNGPWEFFNKWNFADPNPTAEQTANSTPRDPSSISQTETHSFMLDAVAAQGDVILPYSYAGAKLTQSAGSDPRFSFNGYNHCNSTPPSLVVLLVIKDCGFGQSISVDADYLNQEIASINSVWRDSEIILLGHSQGGLFAGAARDLTRPGRSHSIRMVVEIWGTQCAKVLSRSRCGRGVYP